MRGGGGGEAVLSEPVATAPLKGVGGGGEGKGRSVIYNIKYI